MSENIIGFTCGAFDLLHVGHLHFLSECAKQCDQLVVGLHTDPTIDRPDTKNKPVQSVFERYYQLASTQFVDSVVPYDTELDLCNMLATLPIDVRFLGSDYVDVLATGTDICKELGIRIAYIPRVHTYSSTDLRYRVITNS